MGGVWVKRDGGGNQGQCGMDEYRIKQAGWDDLGCTHPK